MRLYRFALSVTCLWLAGFTLAACGEAPDADDDDLAAGEFALTSTKPKQKIGSFNIQNFGLTKAKRAGALDLLAQQARKFAILAVQEISDKGGTVPGMYRDAINSDGHVYEYVLSQRTGRQKDDPNDEQYAFFYDTKLVKLLGSADYDDAGWDYFTREPFAARFQFVGSTFNFVLIDIHTSPDVAVSEIDHLASAIDWAKSAFAHERDFFILGDFNADCKYATPAQLDALKIRGTSYIWWIPDTADTTVASTDCAYDRFVATAVTKSRFTGKWGIERFDEGLGLSAREFLQIGSDHYPIWVEVQP